MVVAVQDIRDLDMRDAVALASTAAICLTALMLNSIAIVVSWGAYNFIEGHW